MKDVQIVLFSIAMKFPRDHVRGFPDSGFGREFYNQADGRLTKEVLHTPDVLFDRIYQKGCNVELQDRKDPSIRRWLNIHGSDFERALHRSYFVVARQTTVDNLVGNLPSELFYTILDFLKVRDYMRLTMVPMQWRRSRISFP